MAMCTPLPVVYLDLARVACQWLATVVPESGDAVPLAPLDMRKSSVGVCMRGKVAHMRAGVCMKGASERLRSNLAGAGGLLQREPAARKLPAGTADTPDSAAGAAD